jgi:eukaryotic-like serine/threonine-protein kinase
MNMPLSLDRLVAQWMAENAPAGPAEQLVDQILTATAQQRPRPRWLALLQEPPMTAQTRVLVGSPNRRLALLATLMLLAALAAAAVGAYLLQQPKPTASDDWPGFRGDATHAGLGARGPIGNPVVSWKATVDGPIRNAISILGDTVVVPSDAGTLTAFGVEDGAQRWSFTAIGPMGGPYAADGRIYAVDGDSIVHAVQAADGKPIWASTQPIDGASSPTFANGRLYVGTATSSVVALDAASGARLWEASVAPSGQGVRAPAIGNGLLVAVADDGTVTGLDAATGSVRWTNDIGDDPLGTPVVAGDLVYVGSSADAQNGRLIVLDAADGSEKWRIDQNIYSPSIFGSMGYTGSPVGTIAAADIASGARGWTAQVDGMTRAPAVTDAAVYVPTDGGRQLVALDRATGGLLWTFDLDATNHCCIAVSRGKLFVGTEIGTVYAIGGDGATLATGPVPSLAALPSAVPAPSVVPVPNLDTKVEWAVTSGASDFTPWGLTKAPDGRLWVTEGLSDRFAIFTADGKFVETWGSSGRGDGEFDLTRANGDPFGYMAFEPDGSFFVLDVGNHRVQAFDKDRRFVRKWGSLGMDPGQFTDPGGIAVDADGNLSVLDNARGVIETYRPDGTITSTIDGFPEELGASVGVNAGVNHLSIGPNGHFFLSVVHPTVVAEIDRDGKLVRTFGAAGRPGALTEQPNGTAFDADGRVYVAQGLLRGDAPGVLVFAPDGTYLGGFAPLGIGDGDLGFAWGLVVDSNGIYVADAGAVDGRRSALRKFEPIVLK